MNGLQLQNWLKVMRDPKSGKALKKLENPENRHDRCCLGHLCHAMQAKSKVANFGSMHSSDGGRDCVFYDFNDHRWTHDVLPNELAKELDITFTGSFNTPIDIDGCEVSSMASLNDDTDLTPAEIANVIESQFKAGNVTPYDSGRF